jgi:hypothetical protein
MQLMNQYHFSRDTLAVAAASPHHHAWGHPVSIQQPDSCKGMQHEAVPLRVQTSNMDVTLIPCMMAICACCAAHSLAALQICEAFNANRYPFPEDPARQRQMHGEVRAHWAWKIIGLGTKPDM